MKIVCKSLEEKPYNASFIKLQQINKQEMLEKAINGIRNSSILDTEQETRIHLFWNCTLVVAFVNLVSTWLYTNVHDVNITLSKEVII